MPKQCDNCDGTGKGRCVKDRNRFHESSCWRCSGTGTLAAEKKDDTVEITVEGKTKRISRKSAEEFGLLT